ncbi:MAG: cobalamin biosynthesis protein CobT [Hyphomonadaceae bacterium]
MTPRISSNYRVYTTEFDTEVSAQELLSDLVVASAPSTWGTDEIEGIERAVAAPHLGKRPLVTLLVDHSGSMKGIPAHWTALALRRAGSMLERSGIPFEILGFTTVNWHGGKARKKWLAAWRPPFPGRLCDLLHIVYQNAETPNTTWKRSLELLTIPSVLKENIDGEALLWASHRAADFRPTFWLCIVVSDGVPIDDSTLEANAIEGSAEISPILSDHLAAVIAALDVVPNVQVAGFGIGCEVGDYYDEHDHAIVETAHTGKLADFVSRLVSEGA